MTVLFLIVGLLLATPAWSQPTPVYTNADLGHPVSPSRPTVTPAQLASLAAHQYRVPIRPSGPSWVRSGLSPTMGPFGDYQTDAWTPRRLDGSLYSDPPWQTIAYVPGFYGHYGAYATGSGDGRAHRRREGPARSHSTGRTRGR